MEGGLEIVDGVVQRPQSQVFVLGATDEVASGDGQSSDGVHVRRLEGGQRLHAIDVQSSNMVVSSAIVEDIIVRSLYEENCTIEKIS